ncbi:flagellar hook-length control protein FliK [Uliginosibacterium sp. H3]|uniref:Flagellar hook-length control protein FliK n=1 Tax=Uliginosibacterium silvisoli TaxID=3114758 RepID=A0ABU6K7H2_9RHOO|nr:flagellar hook-length control protein FliK [Uliginosibacterium sp. H3]
MPEVNNVSPILPVAAAAPAQGSGSNSAVSQGDGQSSFSQVLRDKQAAADKANTPEPAKTQAKSKTDKADGKSDAAATDETVEDEAVARTPAELAQLLAAMANTQNNATSTGNAGDVAADATVGDATGKAAADTGIMALLPKDDKTAATAANLAGATATTTTSGEQTLANQALLAKADVKDSPAGGSSNGDQPSEKQPLLQVAGQGDADKARAAANESDTSFAAALDRASQNAEVRTGMQPTNATQTQSTQATTTHTVATPVGRQGWADEIGQRVLWTAKTDSSRADLILTPPQLGRIEVSIQMNGDQASASFLVANPVAREALQDAMPKLRELMSQAGIQLGQADVSAGQSGQNSGQNERHQSGRSGIGNGLLSGDNMIGATSGQWTRQGTGLVDTFA